MYATHQCARFCEDPKEVHGQVEEYIVRYLEQPEIKVLFKNQTKKSRLKSMLT